MTPRSLSHSTSLSRVLMSLLFPRSPSLIPQPFRPERSSEDVSSMRFRSLNGADDDIRPVEKGKTEGEGEGVGDVAIGVLRTLKNSGRLAMERLEP